MMKKIPFVNKKALAISIGGLAAGALCGPSTFAQESARSTLEEVMVSSRRYEENQQDTPVAVTAMTNKYLEEQGIGTVSEVILNSPGASFTQFNKMQAEYGMRGVSSQTEGASGDSSVTTIIDNIAISKDFMKNPAFFDMSRVEVLRGPQGTSFGRNASSGLIHLISARPEEEFNGGVTVDVGSHGLINTDAYITGSLSDTVTGRIAVNVDSRDGYTEDTRSGKDLGGEENRAVRGSLLFTPSDSLQIYLKAEYSEDNDDSPAVRKSRDCGGAAYQEAGADSFAGP
ncbi:MAG: TonB-dependent receptor plug domain-containing protein, partial [Spongiibacteraceae bacterium]|nr:TonB-dependent receptor plug domain-containing protein [Spongiibacteraceae bacterium]